MWNISGIFLVFVFFWVGGCSRNDWGKIHNHTKPTSTAASSLSKGMVIRSLKKIHDKILRRLRKTPNLATSWRVDFTVDVPLEVFTVISCHIIQSNNFGHQFRETSACIDFVITEMRKAVFIFNKMNLEGVLISRDNLLKKCFGSGNVVQALERCEVVVNETKPSTLKYHKNTEVLSVHFFYGYWNRYGIPQH